MMATTTNNRVKVILSEAEKDIKGRYYIYERYKRMLQGLCLSPLEYERAVVELVKILKV